MPSKPDLDLFDAETAAAVDKFRGTSRTADVPADGLDIPRGLVDASFSIKALFAAYRAVIKDSADKGVGATRIRIDRSN